MHKTRTITTCISGNKYNLYRMYKRLHSEITKLSVITKVIEIVKHRQMIKRYNNLRPYFLCCTKNGSLDKRIPYITACS